MFYEEIIIKRSHLHEIAINLLTLFSARYLESFRCCLQQTRINYIICTSSEMLFFCRLAYLFISFILLLEFLTCQLSILTTWSEPRFQLMITTSGDVDGLYYLNANCEVICSFPVESYCTNVEVYHKRCSFSDVGLRADCLLI